MDNTSAHSAWLIDEKRFQQAGWTEQAQMARYFAALAANEPSPSQYAPERLRHGLSDLDRR